MPGPRGLVQRVDQELHRSGLLPRGARLLVGVSGGADSVAMLRLLAAVNGSDYWGWRLMVGHVDHGMRGRASAGDARFVGELAEGLGVRCFTKRLRLGKGASEDVARRGRLGALGEMVRRQGCSAVVLGQHADDQAETVLLRLFRGTGLEGLGGMGADVRVGGLRILRPLLGVRRRELRAFLREVGQGFREDGSNFSERYLRNRLRKRILPEVERLAPGAVEAIGRAAILARQGQRVVEGAVERLMEAGVILKSPRRVRFERGCLRGAEEMVCGEALRRAVEHLGGSSEGADFERVREAVRVIREGASGKRVELGGGVELVVGREAVTLERRSVRLR